MEEEYTEEEIERGPEIKKKGNRKYWNEKWKQSLGKRRNTKRGLRSAEAKERRDRMRGNKRRIKRRQRRQDKRALKTEAGKTRRATAQQPHEGGNRKKKTNRKERGKNKKQ